MAELIGIHRGQPVPDQWNLSRFLGVLGMPEHLELMREQHNGKGPNHHRCNAGKAYGKTVRVKQEIDLRRFPPIPRATKKFERLYRGRTAVERVNARLKVFWGVDDGNVAGARRFHANVSAVMLVHAGLATLLAACPRREGTLGQTRLSPIAKALQQQLRA